MNFVITFLEGIITFISPCLLPMLPIYVAYFAGNAGKGNNADGTLQIKGAAQPKCPMSSSSGTRRTVICALGFVMGFSTLFCTMGAFAGVTGAFLSRWQSALDALCGSIVIVLGLNYLGALRIPLLQRTLKPKVDIVPRGFFSSLVFGAIFALGWTPCVGAFLGSALSLAATSGQAGRGVALLLSYSLGLGLPFFLCALFIDQLESTFSWMKRHYNAIDKVCGGLLVLVGLMMATGTLGIWLRTLSG